MNLRIDLNEPRIREKVTSDRFGLLVSNEWKRLIDPYTPRDTATLMNNVRFKPWQIHYFTPDYPEIVYYNPRGVKFVTQGTGRNPYATDHWDIKAEQAGQKDSLYRIANNALQSGRF